MPILLGMWKVHFHENRCKPDRSGQPEPSISLATVIGSGCRPWPKLGKQKSALGLGCRRSVALSPPGVVKPVGSECVAAGAAILLRRNPPWRSRAQDREGLSPDSIWGLEFNTTWTFQLHEKNSILFFVCNSVWVGLLSLAINIPEWYTWPRTNSPETSGAGTVFGDLLSVSGGWGLTWACPVGRERSGVLGESVTKRHKVGEGPRWGKCHRD